MGSSGLLETRSRRSLRIEMRKSTSCECRLGRGGRPGDHHEHRKVPVCPLCGSGKTATGCDFTRIQSWQFAALVSDVKLRETTTRRRVPSYFRWETKVFIYYRPTVDFRVIRVIKEGGTLRRCRRAGPGQVQINNASSSSTRRRERGLRLASRRASKAARNPFIRALLSRAGARRLDWKRGHRRLSLLRELIQESIGPLHLRRSQRHSLCCVPADGIHT